MTLHWHRTRRRLLGVVAACAVVALAITACGGAGGGGDRGTFKFRVSTIYGPDNWQTLGLKAYTDAVTKKSDGRITFEYFYQDSLVAVPEFADAMKNGVIDLAPLLSIYTPEKFPIDNWLSTIAFEADDGPPANVLQGSAATQEWAFNEPNYTKEYEKNGLHVIVPSTLPHPKYDLLCTKGPLKSLADLKNLNVRISGEATAGIAKALGMAPTSIPPAEIFDAMQRGVIDCMLGPVIDFDSLGLLDIAKYGASLNVVGFSASTLMMSQDKWRALPEDLQTVMTESATDFVKTFIQGKLSGEAASHKKVEKLGIQFDAPQQDVVDAIEAWQKKQLQSAVKTAPPLVESPAESVQRYVDLHDKWSKLLTKADYKEYESWSAWAKANPKGDVDLEPWVELLDKRVYGR